MVNNNFIHFNFDTPWSEGSISSPVCQTFHNKGLDTVGLRSQTYYKRQLCQTFHNKGLDTLGLRSQSYYERPDLSGECSGRETRAT
eukprot:scaffold8397_cov90-Cylindrotheca_fusiformis.AAC.2